MPAARPLKGRFAAGSPLIDSVTPAALAQPDRKEDRRHADHEQDLDDRAPDAAVRDEGAGRHSCESSHRPPIV